VSSKFEDIKNKLSAGIKKPWTKANSDTACVSVLESMRKTFLDSDKNSEDRDLYKEAEEIDAYKEGQKK